MSAEFTYSFIAEKSEGKICTAAGLACLAKTDWAKSVCDCLPLCWNDEYRRVSTVHYVSCRD